MSGTEPYFSDDMVTVHLGDCLDVLAAMESESIDAVVTDPPYGLAELPAAIVAKALAAWLAGDRAHVPDGRGFMGREWDKFVPPPAAWDKCMRVLKPGGHLLAFAAPRTQDLMCLSIRLAGFEIRESLHWIFGQGMPKSLDVSKAIDKAAGADRRVTAEGVPLRRMIPGATQNATGSWLKDNGREYVPQVTEPATADAARWDGWGTGLKPSHEPIVVARKPLAGTVVQNVFEHGTGALNIDACRVAATDQKGSWAGYSKATGGTYAQDAYSKSWTAAEDGNPGSRWPPNVLLSHSADCLPLGLRQVRSDGRNPAVRGPGGVSISGHTGQTGQQGLTERAAGVETVEAWDCAADCPVAEMDRQSGVLTSGANPARRGSDKFRDAYGEFAGQEDCIVHRGANSGGASRFFPVFRYEAKADAAERPRLADGTAHPTVKPVDLMRWLIRLVTPPGGVVLDPFAGSGTTGEACIIEGFRSVLIECDPKYAELIMTRLRKPIQPDLFGGAA